MTIQERLRRLEDLDVNYDVDAFDPGDGSWREDHYRAELPKGSFELAQHLLRDYRFADPSIVRAHYDEDAPLEGRDMLLELRWHGLRWYVGCRVGAVVDETREVDGRPVRVWGWPYRTLEGHIEAGEMSWQVWQWLDTDEVEFHIDSYSRFVWTGNPIVWAGFRVLGQRERHRYLDGACRRMRDLVAGAREGAGRP
jgi:uncharacterized protein (UPF0548 family)